MVKLASPTSKDTIDMLAGVIDFYDYLGIHCARKWPVKKVKEPTLAEKVHHPAFTYINKLAGHLPLKIIDQWRAMAAGTNLTWKDLLVRAYTGHTYQPKGYPKTFHWPESDAHFAITAWNVSQDHYYIILEIWTDVPCRLRLARLERLPIKKIHTRVRRGNPNFKDLWWYWYAESFEAPLPPEDTTHRVLYLHKGIPHYRNGTFFAATQGDLWMSSISQYFSPQDILLA